MQASSGWAFVTCIYPRGMASRDGTTDSAAVLQRATGALARAAVARMESDVPWFRELSADDKSWVGLIVQAGIKGFVDWYRAGQASAPDAVPLAAELFGVAPRALTRVITLRQTVDLIRLGLEVVEANLGELLPAAESAAVHNAVLLYGREVAFATAEVYARAAEVRGAWDARLEALVVDSIMRAETDESVLSRAAALGWTGRGAVCVLMGEAPGPRVDTAVFDEVRRTARAAGMEALCGSQGALVIVAIGGIDDPLRAAEALVGCLGPGPVVVGPLADGLAQAHRSARAAWSAYRAAPGWPAAPRPVASTDLLPERVLGGDGHARRYLVDHVYRPLAESRSQLETLTAYFGSGSSVEATARALFVHPNTVRYRLRQAADLTGFSPTEPRAALALQIALALGRLLGHQTGQQPSRAASVTPGEVTR